jgi:hypothetical protein
LWDAEDPTVLVGDLAERENGQVCELNGGLTLREVGCTKMRLSDTTGEIRWVTLEVTV